MNHSRARTHGGTRAGAGRKRALSWRQLISVGAECERLWREAAEEGAFAQYEQDPRVKEIRIEQGRSELIPQRLRRTRSGKESMRDIEDDIETILGDRRRAVSIPVKRPWGARSRIIERARAWCRDRYGLNVTARRVEAGWDAYRDFLRKLPT